MTAREQVLAYLQRALPSKSPRTLLALARCPRCATAAARPFARYRPCVRAAQRCMFECVAHGKPAHAACGAALLIRPGDLQAAVPPALSRLDRATFAAPPFVQRSLSALRASPQMWPISFLKKRIADVLGKQG